MPTRWYPDPTRNPPAPGPGTPRVFTRGLTVFLLAVAAVVGTGLQGKSRRPGVEAAVLELADGDLDGDERRRMLRILVDGALQSEQPGHRWAGMLAAVALDDRDAYARVRAPLGGAAVPTVLPPGAERELLHLGDPMLGNLAQALLAEAAGDRPLATRLWRQVANQCRLLGRGFGAELASAALARLG